MSRNKEHWEQDQIKCELCTYSWVAVYPNDVEEVRCPNCGYMTELDG